MEKGVRNRNHYHTRGSGGEYNNANTNKGLEEADLVLQWGSRKRLRCVKVHRRDHTDKATTNGRVLRHNSEATMRGGGGGGQQQGNGGARGGASPVMATAKGSGSSEGAAAKSSSGSEAAAAAAVAWPKFAIALTAKEKEEDFLVFKGSKLPQRPKKRAKLIQRTLNLVSPGAWLCDLTLERYEVREKKVTKKRPRGLKAMGNMDSDSE